MISTKSSFGSFSAIRRGIIMKITYRIIASLLCAATIISCIPFTAVAGGNDFIYVKGSNNVSDSYKNSVYYEKLTSITLTGDGRSDLLAVALSQLGYRESGMENDFDGEPNGSGSNFTEYNYSMGDFGVGYGGGSYPWCASFVAWCLLQSGCTTQNRISDWCRYHTDDKAYIWREVGCTAWAGQLRRYGYFEYSRKFGGNYTPIGGDLIFFTWDGAKHSEDHIGIVVYCDGSTVYTVEGNTADAAGLETNGDGVYFKSYPITSPYISGYGVLPYKTTESPKADYSGSNPTGGLYIAERKKEVYLSSVSDETVATIPRFALIEVIRPAKNGRLRIVCTVNGKTVRGYIDNDRNRVLPLVYAENVPRGDLNFDGVINRFDYILAKRSILGTFDLSDGQNDRCDINDDGAIDQFDYILIKRHCMNTYTISD